MSSAVHRKHPLNNSRSTNPDTFDQYDRSKAARPKRRPPFLVLILVIFATFITLYVLRRHPNKSTSPTFSESRNTYTRYPLPGGAWESEPRAAVVAAIKVCGLSNIDNIDRLGTDLPFRPSFRNLGQHMLIVRRGDVMISM